MKKSNVKICKKIVDSEVDTNWKFYWKIALFRIMISDDSMKEHTDIVNVKYEGNSFAMNSMEQTSNILSR